MYAASIIMGYFIIQLFPLKPSEASEEIQEEKGTNTVFFFAIDLTRVIRVTVIKSI